MRVKTPTYELTSNAIIVPGYASNDIPGTPALPVWGTTVELPPSGDWQVSYDSSRTSLLNQLVDLRSVPVPALTPPRPGGWVSVVDMPGSIPTVDNPNPDIFQVNAFYPDSPVVPGEVEWQRGRRLLALRVFPFQYNPVTHQVRYHPDLTITVRGDAASGPDRTSGAIGSTGAGPATNPAASLPGSLRISTAGRGMYRLTYDDLAAAGVPLATVDPASFALSYLGEPVAIEVTGDGDTSFEPGELVIFYAVPYQGRYQTNNTYWFAYGGPPGLLMNTRAVDPTGSEPLITTITQTLQVEFDREYRSTYPRPQDADHWFDTPLSPDILTGVVTVTRDYSLVLDDALTSGAVEVRAALNGGADQVPNPDKSIALRLNNHPLGTFQWEGLGYYIASAAAPAAWLDGAPNQISLVAAISQLPGLDFYSVSPDWVELTYPALAEAEDDRINIEEMAEGANDVAVAGFSTPDVLVYDVRQPLQPVKLLTTQATGPGAPYTLHFWDDELPDPTYALSSVAALLAPSSIVRDTASSWRSSDHEADYIAVVHSSLSAAIQPLLDYRAAEGLRVVKVDVQDIYDEWSFGQRDPEAIRSFLSYAYHCWNGADCDPDPGEVPDPPQFVLLVGDGHYDFTGVSGTTMPNLIPPYLIHIDPWLGETSADNRFVSVDGPDDYLADMAIGRIPAIDPANVTAVVEKIIAYETAAPDGDWQKRVVFVADNNLDPAGNFHAFSDNIRSTWLPAPYNDSTVYYNRDYFTGAAMRTAIKTAFNNDAFLLQWFGHGAARRWGSVSMFNIFDPPALTANDTWPFTTSYTCYTGYFQLLIGTDQSLAEVLLMTPLRGSVADFSSSGANVGDSLIVLNQGMTQTVFRKRIDRAGPAVDATKLYYFENSGSFRNVIDTYIYFGDPALKLRLPPIDLSSSEMAVSPAVAEPGATLHYTVTLQNTGTFTATDVTVAVDYADANGQVVASQPAALDAGGVLTWTLPSVSPGTTELTFALGLEPVQPAGVTDLHAPTAVRSWGNVLADLDAVSQVSAAPDLSPSTLAVSRAWMPPGYPLTVTLTLSNTGNAPSAATWLTATLPTDLISVTSASLIYDPSTRRLTWQGVVEVGQPIPLTFTSVITPTRTACGQLEVPAAVRDELGQVAALTATVNLAVPDVDCSGDVDITDVQQVSARWGAVAGDPEYDPRYDLDADDAIGVADIIAVALRWQ